MTKKACGAPRRAPRGSDARPKAASKAALILPLALIAASPLYCKDKIGQAEDVPSLRQDASGSIRLETSISWRDVGTEAATDWAAAPGSPSFALEAEGDLGFKPEAAPWLRAGLSVRLEAELKAKAKSPADNEPYLVIREETALAAAGPYLGLKAWIGAWDARLRATALACARILALTDADFDYQPTGASGEDFWFRVLPGFRSTLDASLALGDLFGAELENDFLAWRGAEDAYGTVDAGFREEVKLAATARLLSSGAFDLDAALKLSAAWDSGIVLSSRALKARIESELGLDGGISLRLVPASIERKEDMPGFDQGRSENAAIRLGGGLEWRQKLSSAEMRLGLSWPYQAWDGSLSPDRSLAEWKATASIELK